METRKLIKDAPHQKYITSEGWEVPGGSTICKIGDSPEPLIMWAWKLGMEGKDYRKERDRAADVGTLAHFMCEAYLNGFVCDLSDYKQEDRDRALVCYNKFLDYWEEQELEVVATEIQLVHPTIWYGGTIDLIAKRKNGDHVLLDFKTSKRISDSYWRQVAGYAQLWNEHDSGCCDDFIHSHAIVRIGKEDENDFEVVWRDDLSKEWFVFQRQVDLYWALKAAKPEPKPRGRKKKA
jgi:hypothetical protein